MLRPSAAVLRAPGRLAQPSTSVAVLLFGTAVAVLSVPLVAMLPVGSAIAVDTVQQAVATGAAVVALLAATGASAARGIRRRLVAGLVLGVLGLVAWSAQPGGMSTSAGGADVLMTAGAAAVLGSAIAAIAREVPRARLGSLAVESLIVLVATATTIVAAWTAQLGPHDDAIAPLAILGSVAIIAGPLTGGVAMVEARIRPALAGPTMVLAGCLAAGVSWLAWLVVLSRGEGTTVMPLDYAFSAGVLLVGWGGVTWTHRPAIGERAERLRELFSMALPLAAVATVLALDLALPEDGGGDPVESGSALVVALALVRQLLLYRDERRARAAEAVASGRLALEVRRRASVLASLGRIRPAETPELTAADLCARAIGVDGIDRAAVAVLEVGGEVTVLAAAGLDAPSGERAPERAGGGGDAIIDALAAAGLPGLVVAPIVLHERIAGVVGLGSADDGGQDLARERLATANEFAVVAAGVLGPALEERIRRAAARQRITAVMEAEAFHPVFQPIVALADGAVVGYEALTRFTDGVRPDVRFAEAAAAGLGLELEWATLRAALAASASLPPGAYLSVNASPDLVWSLPVVLDELETAGRPLVIEVTEHAAVDSYGSLRDSLAELRDRVRIAVDDAGAGYAGLQHIVELAPDVVKLDVALIRGVDRDRARRALVASMVGFAREMGSVLVAEGVETPEEAATLHELGVGLGQGYLFGRPAPATPVGA